MTDPTLTTGTSPSSDGLATIALFLHTVAVVASTVCLVAVLVGESTLAITAGLLALIHLGGATATRLVDSSLQRRFRAGNEPIRPLPEYALASGPI